MPKLHILYIPGLGDKNVSGQIRAINIWRFWGVTPELLQMNWANAEPWESKFKRLLARIDELHSKGESVGLVGVSAGASAVMNAYAARKNKLVGVVCIAGKINRPNVIGSRYRKNNPAFVTSAEECEKALQTLDATDRRRILSQFGLFDPVVSKVDSRVPGARNRFSPTIGHTITIVLQITFGAPSFLRFLKKLSKS